MVSVLHPVIDHSLNMDGSIEAGIAPPFRNAMAEIRIYADIFGV